jgi:5-methylcytosine-specific restriction endonuclease McrA
MERAIILNTHELDIYALRMMDYSEYLQTDHWQMVRKAKLKQAGYKCQHCGASNTVLHVHHLTYSNRGNENLSDLIVLCKTCHESEHATDY